MVEVIGALVIRAISVGQKGRHRKAQALEKHFALKVCFLLRSERDKKAGIAFPGLKCLDQLFCIRFENSVATVMIPSWADSLNT